MRLRPRTGGADMDLTVRIEGADMARMSDLVRGYGGFNVAAGELSVYSELQVTGGAITGYVKPLFRDVKVGVPPGARAPGEGFGHRFYEGAVAAAAKILKNRSRGEVATVVTSGHPLGKSCRRAERFTHCGPPPGLRVARDAREAAQSPPHRPVAADGPGDTPDVALLVAHSTGGHEP